MTHSLSPKRTYSSRLQDDELSDYSGTRLTDGTCSLSPKRIFTSTRRQLVDYLNTRFEDGTKPLSPIETVIQDLQFTGFYALEESFRLLQYSNNLPTSNKGTTHPRGDKQIDYYGTRTNKSRQSISKVNQSIVRQKKKVLYIRMLKVLKRTLSRTKAKWILQQLFKTLAPAPRR